MITPSGPRMHIKTSPPSCVQEAVGFDWYADPFQIGWISGKLKLTRKKQLNTFLVVPVSFHEAQPH